MNLSNAPVCRLPNKQLLLTALPTPLRRDDGTATDGSAFNARVGPDLPLSLTGMFSGAHWRGGGVFAESGGVRSGI